MKNLINPSIGLEIRLQRKKRGLSLEAVSWKTGLSISHISKVERGKTFPSDKTLRKLEDALDLEYMSLEEGKWIMKINDSIEQTVGEIKIDLLNRELSEIGIAIVAEMTKAVADVVEGFEL